jgi:hypothetical protein
LVELFGYQKFTAGRLPPDPAAKAGPAKAERSSQKSPEYLDGGGYSGGAPFFTARLVRILIISDAFPAAIEIRSYQPWLRA